MGLASNLIIERNRHRRWIPAILPILACIAGVTWFMRTYVSPPKIDRTMSPAAMLLAEPIQFSIVDSPKMSSETSAPSGGAMPSVVYAAAPTFPPPLPAGAAPTTAVTATVPLPRPNPQREIAATVADAVAIPIPRARPSQASAGGTPLESDMLLPQEESRPAQVNPTVYDRHSAE
jgi:hypothetical protein